MDLVKKARAWLDARGLAYSWVDLRQSPPTAKQIDAWLAAFDFKPMRNTSGGSYRALGDEKSAWGAAQWREAFLADAMLLKRPVIERDGAPVLVGFNAPEPKLVELLS